MTGQLNDLCAGHSLAAARVIHNNTVVVVVVVHDYVGILKSSGFIAI